MSLSNDMRTCTRVEGMPPIATKYLNRGADRIEALEAALAAIYLAADNARNEQEWADMVSAEMTDERRALATK